MKKFSKRRTPPGIPLSAMGDIAFLLLIFYMATTMVTDQKPRDIAVPELDSPAQTSPYPIVIYLDKELAGKNQVYLFNKKVPIKNLGSALQEKAATAPVGGARFFLNIERDLPYRYFHEVMQALKHAGARSLIITTRPQENGTNKAPPQDSAKASQGNHFKRWQSKKNTENTTSVT